MLDGSDRDRACSSRSIGLARLLRLPRDQPQYDMIGTPTIADVVLDRLVHNAYHNELFGECMRKPKVLPVADATPA